MDAIEIEAGPPGTSAGLPVINAQRKDGGRPTNKGEHLVESVSGKQMCPKIMGVICRRWELKKNSLFKILL